MLAAVIQMNSSADRQANLAQAADLLRRAAGQGAGLCVLPEHFAHMQPEGLPLAEPQTIAGPTVSFLATLARELGLWIVGGTFAERARAPGKAHNTCPVLDPTGRLVGVYRKIHLFDLAAPGQAPLLESRRVAPGRRLTVVDTPIGRLGPCVCYDLRFPELHRRLRLLGAQVIAAPSAFTKLTGQAHWELLVRARAVENACFVLAAAQWGPHGQGRESFGQAMITNPWGEVVAQCPPGPGLALAEVNAEVVEGFRRRLDSTLHARLLPRAWRAKGRP